MRQHDMIPMRDTSLVEKTDRLFYELGYKRHIMCGVDSRNWVRTGEFKEIQDPTSFLKNDHRLSDIAYLEHHNFMIVKTIANG